MFSLKVQSSHFFSAGIFYPSSYKENLMNNFDSNVLAVFDRFISELKPINSFVNFVANKLVPQKAALAAGCFDHVCWIEILEQCNSYCNSNCKLVKVYRRWIHHEACSGCGCHNVCIACDHHVVTTQSCSPC